MKPIVTVVLLLLSAGCSINGWAVNKIGNMLASGGSTFTSDDDPELVEAAMYPSVVKLYESLLANRPSNRPAASAGPGSPNTPTLRGFPHRRSPRREPGTRPMPSASVRASSISALIAMDARPRGESPGLAAALDRCRPRLEARYQARRSIAVLTAASRGLNHFPFQNQPELIAGCRCGDHCAPRRGAG